MKTAASPVDDEFDIRAAARREARGQGLALGDWLDGVMAERAEAIGVSLADLDPDQRIDAVMARLRRPGRHASQAAEGPFKPRTGKAMDSADDRPGQDSPIGDSQQDTRRDGMMPVALLRESFEDLSMNEDTPVLAGSEARAGSPLAQRAERENDSWTGDPGVPALDEGPSRAERAASAASRQAAQRVEIESKLAALFTALDRTPRRADHAAAAQRDDASLEAGGEARVASLLGETAISPSWRLEKAVGEIADRQAFLERQSLADGGGAAHARPVAVAKLGGPRAAAEDLRRHFEQPAPAKADKGPANGVAEVAPARPAQSAHDVPSVFTSLQGDIARLAKRLDAVHFDVTRRPPPSPAKDTSLDEIRALLDGMRPDVSIDALGRHVETLSVKLDRMSENRVPADAINRLSQRIEDVHAEVAARLAAQPVAPTIDMAAIEQLIGDLIARAERPVAAVPDMRALEDAVHDLTAKLDAADRSPNGADMLAELQAQVSQLAGRIDKSDAGLIAIVAMERSLGEIFAQMGEVREAAIQVSESTARAAAQDTVRAVLADQALMPPPSSVASDAAVEQVTRELADLRVTRSDADKRLHAILGALNVSLERVVDRLTALEDEASEARLRPPSEPKPTRGLAPPRPLSMPEPIADAAEEAADLAAASVLSARPPIPRASAGPIDLDTPIEPRVGGSARQPTPSTDAPDAAGPIITSAPDPSTFIAAARRAAQNATAEQNQRADEASGARPRVAGLAADSGLSKRFKTGMLSRRRPLLLALASLVVLAGAVQLLRVSMDSTPGATAPTGDATATTPLPPPAAEPTAADPAPVPAPGRSDASDPMSKPETQTAVDGAAKAPEAAAKTSDAGPATTGSIAVASSVTDPAAAGKTLPTMAMGAAANVAALQTADLSARVAAMGGIGAGLRALADDGNAGAQFEIGLRYADGRGVARDMKLAASWFEKAARQGLAPAAYRLGSLYEKGLGVPRDAAQSMSWYQKAADAGNVRAMHNLAVMQAEGAAGKSDYTTAASWFTKAAEAGVRDSQFNLAILYARGMGVEQNLSRSYVWFAIAAANGDLDSAKKRDDVAARLDADTLASAKKTVANFKTTATISAANDVQPPAGGWDAAAAPRPASANAPKPTGNAHLSRL